MNRGDLCPRQRVCMCGSAHQDKATRPPPQRRSDPFPPSCTPSDYVRGVPVRGRAARHGQARRHLDVPAEQHGRRQCGKAEQKRQHRRSVKWRASGCIRMERDDCPHHLGFDWAASSPHRTNAVLPGGPGVVAHSGDAQQQHRGRQRKVGQLPGPPVRQQTKTPVPTLQLAVAPKCWRAGAPLGPVGRVPITQRCGRRSIKPECWKHGRSDEQQHGSGGVHPGPASHSPAGGRTDGQSSRLPKWHHSVQKSV